MDLLRSLKQIFSLQENNTANVCQRRKVLFSSEYNKMLCKEKIEFLEIMVASVEKELQHSYINGFTKDTVDTVGIHDLFPFLLFLNERPENGGKTIDLSLKDVCVISPTRESERAINAFVGYFRGDPVAVPPAGMYIRPLNLLLVDQDGRHRVAMQTLRDQGQLSAVVYDFKPGTKVPDVFVREDGQYMLSTSETDAVPIYDIRFWMLWWMRDELERVKASFKEEHIYPIVLTDTISNKTSIELLDFNSVASIVLDDNWVDTIAGILKAEIAAYRKSNKPLPEETKRKDIHQVRGKDLYFFRITINSSDPEDVTVSLP